MQAHDWRAGFRRWLLLWVSLATLLSGCASDLTSGNKIGARPAASVIASVETYLERYQPGPTPRLFQTTRIYDRQGRLLTERFDEGRRTWVGLDRISQNLLDATIATEDATFYTNGGVDPARIAGAALQNSQQGETVSGASTITMQLARNLFMGPDQRYDQSMDRKLAEAGLAQELTGLFSKNEILEMYLNLLNYGHLAYGPEAAAQVYFGKSAADLDLAEATLLAGIPQRPANLDLFTDLEAAKQRQRVVLDMMVRHNYLSQAAADQVFARPVNLNPDPDRVANLAPHFTQYVEEILDARLGQDVVSRGGLTITTTLDVNMQMMAQRVVSQKVAELQPAYDLSNAALVAIQPATGEILVMVGSADFANAAIAGQVNVAVSPRQPGSAIKPILYATAFNDNLLSPASVLWDIPVTYTIGAEQIYTPANYDGRFHGPVTVRTALANSYNIPAVKALHGLTVDRMLESAQAMGIHSLSRDSQYYGLSLTLGGGDVTLLELTNAYATLANDGVFVPPTAVLSVRDGQGNVLPRSVVQGEVDLSLLGGKSASSAFAQGQPGTGQPAIDASLVISPAAAFLVTDILSDNAARTPAFGPDSPLVLNRPAAAKTGTTNDWRDNWTLGYTRYLVAGVWAGNSDGHPMKNTTGLTGAAPIWHDFMEGVLADPALLAGLNAPSDPAAWQFIPPPDVEKVSDCPPSVTCKAGGEYFTRAWLWAAGEAGPLSDSVVVTGTAPVYVDRGEGATWAGYCEVEPAAQRTLLRLPGAFGLPNAAQQKPMDADARLEQQQAMAWSLRHATPVDLGPCATLAEAVPTALAIAPQPDDGRVQVLIDLNAAMDPNAGGVPGSAAPAVLPLSPGNYRFVQAQPTSDGTGCPGQYLVGQVLDPAGTPLAGIRLMMIDQYGNRAETVSKDGVDLGRYDFPLNHFANRYTVTVVDAGGNPLSPPAVIDHLQGPAGQAPCHTLIWRAN